MVFTAISDDGGTLSQFLRYQDIIITAGSATPSNYQKMLTIPHKGFMQPDFDDMRFNTLGGGYCDYWIESKTDSDTTDVWVELPNVIGASGIDVIRMFYGNSGLSSESNGSDTFDAFDDFLGALLSADWTTVGTGTETVSNSEIVYDDYNTNDYNPLYYLNTGGFGQNYALKARLKVSEESIPYFGFTDQITNVNYRSIGNGQTIMIYHAAGNNQLQAHSVIASSAEGGADLGNVTAGTYYIYDIIRNGSTSVIYKQNGSTYATHTAKVASTTENVFMSTHGVGTTPDEITFDWIFVRKHVATEPTYTIGTEQHQRRTPQFIN